MRAIAALVLCASLCLISGCDGNVVVINVDGQWVMLIEFNECPMFGFMKGGPSNQIAINMTQTGDQLSTQFQDSDGIDWTGDGFISGLRSEIYWTGRSPDNRVIDIVSVGWIFTEGGVIRMDGYCVVHSDSAGLCYNEQYGFWADIGGTGPQEPPPEVVIRQCPGVDIVFVMDTSGSMGDESQALCDEIAGVEQRLRDLGLSDIRTQLLGLGSGPTFGGGFSCLEDSVANRFGTTVPGSGDTLNSSEDWGPGTAVVAANNNWLSTPVVAGSSGGVPFVRIIVPISDEGPENGGGENSCNQADTDAITNAIAIAQQNNVIVSPIVAALNNSVIDPASCILAEATRLANGTSGTVSQSTDPALDIGQSIFDLIVAACQTVGTTTGN